MISDGQRQFIESLSTDDLRSLYRRTEAYARRRLTRRASVTDPSEASDVASQAFVRLFAKEYAAWVDPTPSRDGLLKYLAERVDDIVRNRSREVRRKHDLGEPEMGVQRQRLLSPESAVLLQDRADDWLEAASDDPQLAEVIVEYLTLNDHAEDQAAALGLTRDQIYRLRTEARNRLRRLEEGQA